MFEETQLDADGCEVASLREDLARLHRECNAKVQRLRELEAKQAGRVTSTSSQTALNNDDIARYSRQLILPHFGVRTQIKIKRSAFLIVGMGGLGCPAAQYLVAAGCGRVGLMDYDEVERNNFHRQILHTEERLGLPKVESARRALLEINPQSQIDTYQVLLNSENALELLQPYDVVLDCSDNVATRYLLNDACVMLNKPLVSGSALQLDGQLTVYHYGAMGPCYRCLYPVPPPPEAVTNCGDGGVLGPVTGVIGSLQALEAIKVVAGGLGGEVLAGRLLIFDGARCTFRNIRLRSRRSNCDVCSASPMITRLIDYEQFCGMPASDKDRALTLLEPEQRISVEEYRTLQSSPHLLIDVRLPAEFEICHLTAAKNVPLKRILDDSYVEQFETELRDCNFPIVVVCRRGNDSQIAVQHMLNRFSAHSIRDITGGLHAWHYNIDHEFPIY